MSDSDLFCRTRDGFKMRMYTVYVHMYMQQHYFCNPQDSVGQDPREYWNPEAHDHLTFPLAPRNFPAILLPTNFHRFSFNRSKFLLNPYSDCASCSLNRGTQHFHSQFRIELPCHFRFQICSFLHHVLCFWNSEFSRPLFGY